MKMKINDFAKLTGVSVRTLHYYDEINLLKPFYVDKWTGYRYYNEASLGRMQEILFYRELDFPLKSIAEIISSPDYDKTKALQEQKKLLILKRKRLDRLISALENAAKGETIMSNIFDNSEFEVQKQKYEAEVMEKWGDTAAYSEYKNKTAGYSDDRQQKLADEFETIFSEFADCKSHGFSADSPEAKALAAKLQKFITDNYYSCTDEILAGLGEMYSADERFRNNINKHGEGTAEFISETIKNLTSSGI